MWVFLILLSLCQGIGSAENCDFVKCTRQFKDFMLQLQSTDGKFNCKSFYKSINPCCFENFFNFFLPSSTFFNDGNTLVEFCEKNLVQYPNVNISCISKHSFRILTCIANVSSMKINDSREFKQSCRKRVEYQKCPEVLNDCGLQSIKFMKDILEFVLSSSKIPYCMEAEVSSIPVIYHLQQDQMMIAQCYDKYFSRLDACFHQLIQDDSDLYGYICGEYVEINDCITYQFSKYSHNYCKSYANVSYKLLKELFTLGNVKCKSNLVLQYLTPQTYNDASTQNIGEIEYESSSTISEQGSTNFNFRTSTVTPLLEIISNNNLSKETKEKLPHTHVDIKLNKSSSTINLLKIKNSSFPYFKSSNVGILNCNKVLLVILIFVVLLQKLFR